MDQKELKNILSKPSVWDLGNNCLYDIFKKHPKNISDEEIIAKVWILGRSYAAAIERRKSKDNYSNGEFYENHVPKAIRASEIDKHIKALIMEKSETKKFNLIFKTHESLQEAISDITGDRKRSFCSKYLHFHLPNLFYIYDTRANEALRKLDSKYKPSRKLLKKVQATVPLRDLEYLKFYVKCDFAAKQISKEIKADLTKRQFDTILLNMGK